MYCKLRRRVLLYYQLQGHSFLVRRKDFIYVSYYEWGPRPSNIYFAVLCVLKKNILASENVVK